MGSRPRKVGIRLLIVAGALALLAQIIRGLQFVSVGTSMDHAAAALKAAPR